MLRFCSACGAPLGARPPTRCAACGQEHWRNAKPGAAALVAQDERLLLVRRAHAPWLGSWCAPSGFCDGDEHPIATAERETLEETGVRIRVTGFLGIWIGRYADEPDDDSDLVSVAYYHAVPLHEAGAPDAAEVGEVAWFAPDELPAALAPPDVLPRVVAAWGEDSAAGRTVTTLPDRP